MRTPYDSASFSECSYRFDTSLSGLENSQSSAAVPMSMPMPDL